MNQHLPPVGWRSRARDEPAVNQPINQFDGAVVLDLQPLGQNPDAGWLSRLC
jgi:hypothetical protein